jgi:chloramphenicol-sensitive protein RarD
MIGVLQFIAPTLQFIIGVFLYHEPFDPSRLIGFSLVWLALLIFWVENYLANRVSVQSIPEPGEG